jgi:integrase
MFGLFGSFFVAHVLPRGTAMGNQDSIEWDGKISGLGLRVRAKSKTWIFRYRHGRTQRSIKLGRLPALSVVAARRAAEKLAAQLALGADPAADRAAAKNQAEHTFALLAEKFLDARRPGLRPATVHEYERHLLRDCKSLHRLPITTVTQADIARLLNNAAGPVTANRLRATLTAMFSWAMREGVKLPDGNIASLTNKRNETGRDRVLSNQELKAIWFACANDNYGNIVKLLILTAARRDEIAHLQWCEIADDNITLPGLRTKNKRSHIIPLSEPAKDIIASIKPSKRIHVFGRDDSGFHGWSKCRYRLDQKLGDAVADDWVLHDLRRTAATRMAELGTQPHIIEAVINHVSGHKGGVAGIYNRAACDKEKRAALNLWAEHVMALVEGRKAVVVSMKLA